MGCKENLEAYLREQGVSFQAQEHLLAYTAQEVAETEHIPGRTLVKVVIVRTDGEMVMLALPAPCHVDFAKAARALGVGEVHLAREREFSAIMPDCEVGAMPPFGNLYGIPVVIDRTVSENDTIVCQSGTHTDTVALRYADFERLVKPGVAEFAQCPG
jgi:Ala-tRNA(Pro) deacylase